MINTCIKLFDLTSTSKDWAVAGDWLEDHGHPLAHVFRSGKYCLFDTDYDFASDYCPDKFGGSGDGAGGGNSEGYGSGTGDGWGNGSGYGFGSGSGEGDGSGHGNGYGDGVEDN